MGKKGVIGIKLSKQRLVALASVYRDLVKGFEREDDHDELIYEHIRSLSHKLNVLECNDQLKYTVTLNGTEALAFMQTWNVYDIAVKEYEGVIVTEVVALIDQESLGAKLLAGAP